jgi:hypothetical protein
VRNEAFHVALQTTCLASVERQSLGLVGMPEIMHIDPIAWRWHRDCSLPQQGGNLGLCSGAFEAADEDVIPCLGDAEPHLEGLCGPFLSHQGRKRLQVGSGGKGQGMQIHGLTRVCGR